MDLKALAKDKRVQVAVLGGALAGVVVFIKRKGAGASDTSPGTVVAGAMPSAAGVNTTGDDVAAWLGDYSSSLQNQLNDYQNQLSDALSTLQTMSPSSTPTDTPTSITTPEPKTKYQDVVAGWSVDQWIHDLQKGFGWQGGNVNASWDLIYQLNPQIANNIDWSGSLAGDSSKNTFKSGASYRIA